jgi:hypothetical protein
MFAAAIPNTVFMCSVSSITFKGTVSSLSQTANRPCHWLHHGIEALRPGPFSEPRARVIDVSNIGRRHEAVHCELLRAAERGKLFYVYVTLASINTNTLTLKCTIIGNTANPRRAWRHVSGI